MFVDDELICCVGAEALCVVRVVVKSHGEGTVVGCKCTEEEEMGQFSLSGHIADLPELPPLITSRLVIVFIISFLISS